MRVQSRNLATLLIAAAVLLAPAAGGTTIVMPTDQQLIEKSPVIVIARVISSRPVERSGGIWTETILEIDRSFRGPLSGTIVVREVGGSIGDRLSVVFGSPQYRAGERVLAFLDRTPRGDFQTVDLFVGKFTQSETPEGRRLWHRLDQQRGTRLLDQDFAESNGSGLQRDATMFEDFLERVLGGEEPLPRYWIQSPRVARDLAGDFTLIDEPNLYRWFAFDDGASVPWRHTGAQPGYANGGVNELQTGLNSWTGYSSAKIRFTYGGASNSAPGGLGTPNGINEVMFGDPKNEIQGSWNGSSGVVGRGGFNSLKGFRSWTSPFAADAAHPARVYSGVGDIAEGDLVIQDGVSPSAGISPTLLAEIIAHEFGHTLGFGHSADSTALMHSSVTGGGPALKSDDQLSARWLYPNAGGGGPAPTVPSPPTNLVASGSGNALQLSWKDNAANESVQTIYLGTSSSNLAPVHSVGANVTSTVVGNLLGGQTYFARVSASNSVGESSPSNLAQAMVPGDVLKAVFLASPTSGIAGVTQFTFIDKSTGPVVSRQWSFGDGGTSAGSSTTHLYAAAGTYTVTLNVLDAQGKASSAQKQISVGATGQAVAAAFTFSPNDPVAGDEVAFSDQSLGALTQWLWSFGDGATSFVRNPVHTYSSPGLFEVTLSVTNGSESSTATSIVNVASGSGITPAVDASFEVSTLWPAAGREVRFFDRSTGSPSIWLWSFGDGTGSVERNPRHVYERPGTYRLTLHAGNAASFSIEEREITISAGGGRFNALLPVAALTVGAASSSWRTELSLANPLTSATNVDLLYLPSTGSPRRKSLVLGAGASVTYENALSELFGLLDGSGAVAIEGSGSPAPDLRISSRTFTTGSRGTYGQQVPAMATQPLTRGFLPGLEWSPDYRTNIGLVNHGSVQAEVRLTLWDSSATPVGSLDIALAGNTFQQTSLAARFPQLDGFPREGLLLRIESTEPALIAGYASIVDNRSQDPVFLCASDGAPAGDLTIPAVARAEGALGTFWRSDVTLFNPSTAPMSVTLKFFAGARRERTITLPSGNTQRISDVLGWLGEQDGQGPLLITSTGSALAPLVSSRTYTTRSGDGGTFGQSIDAVSSHRFTGSSYVVGLRHDAQFRTNIGFVNPHHAAVDVKVQLLGSTGSVAATSSITVAPLGSAQVPVTSLFPAHDLAAMGSFSLHASAEQGIVTYGSVIDNLSGDPVFVAGY